MVADESDDLAEIFRRHRERKQAQSADHEALRAEFASKWQECGSKLREVVLSLVQEWSKRIKSDGHVAKVGQDLERHDPMVRLEMRPEGATRHQKSSYIIFACTWSGSLEVSVGIMGDPPETVKARALAEVTPDWVKKRLLGFVQDVLKRP